MDKKTHDRIEELAEDLQRRAISNAEKAKHFEALERDFQAGLHSGKADAFKLSARWLYELIEEEAS
jgi:hypothetical protein